MSEVVEARKAYEQAQKDAKALVTDARLALGEAISRARENKVPQEAIAIELELTREQVRRFQREYEHTLHTGRLTAPERFDTARRIIIDRARLLDVDQLFEIVDQLHKQVHAKIEES